MTIDEKIELNKKRHCWQIESAADIFENGFISGANFTKSELMPLLEKALEALDKFPRYDDELKERRFYLQAQQTAKEIREVLK